MNLSLVLALIWLVAANLIGMVPCKNKHWPQAYVLIAIGLPILAYVAWDSGILVALIVLAAAASILRWPVRFFVRWVSAQADRLRAG